MYCDYVPPTVIPYREYEIVVYESLARVEDGDARILFETYAGTTSEQIDACMNWIGDEE